MLGSPYGRGETLGGISGTLVFPKQNVQVGLGGETLGGISGTLVFPLGASGKLPSSNLKREIFKIGLLNFTDCAKKGAWKFAEKWFAWKKALVKCLLKKKRG